MCLSEIRGSHFFLIKNLYLFLSEGIWGNKIRENEMYKKIIFQSLPG